MNDFDQPGVFVTQDFLPIVEDLTQSSSTFTEGRKLVINEVFQMQLESPVPIGEHEIKVVASMYREPPEIRTNLCSYVNQPPTQDMSLILKFHSNSAKVPCEASILL